MKRYPPWLTGAAFSLIVSGCVTAPSQQQAENSDNPDLPPVVAAQKAKEQGKPVPVYEQDAVGGIPEGTDIVIRSGTDRTIHEYRINGFLYSIKVIPKIGKPYYLVAVDNIGNFARSNGPQMLIPSWKIMEWQ
ncbi:DUF2782 domain-containing protein [Sansalvadorimonas sp. 2012CJ34-2]|uniref:DUF2782 domain-containing protein n=1 Tax=Parendozoicomonas callyspongiae TaxID=2942213 RepID=A0ABT0PAQ2_9GAMM|nr:DUF2782 domain-containing protein [Sansalvadorimonas sp. 2012CJ34-2]MCL6268473.1 DUF2782 domain-containing protein [Sansalvadorimonas sp. 2012CJ34-2]